MRQQKTNILAASRRKVKMIAVAAAVALTSVGQAPKALAQNYDIDCAILFCMIAGFPSSGGQVCADAYAEMIDRITPWPVEPPLQVCTGPKGQHVNYNAPAFSSLFEGVMIELRHTSWTSSGESESTIHGYKMFVSGPDGSNRQEVLSRSRNGQPYRIEVGQFVGNPNVPSLTNYSGPNFVAEVGNDFGGFHEFVWVFAYRSIEGEWTIKGPYAYGRIYSNDDD